MAKSIILKEYSFNLNLASRSCRAEPRRNTAAAGTTGHDKYFTFETDLVNPPFTFDDDQPGCWRVLLSNSLEILFPTTLTPALSDHGSPCPPEKSKPRARGNSKL